MPAWGSARSHPAVVSRRCSIDQRGVPVQRGVAAVRQDRPMVHSSAAALCAAAHRRSDVRGGREPQAHQGENSRQSRRSPSAAVTAVRDGLGRTVAAGGVHAYFVPNGQQTRNLHCIGGETSAITCMIHPGGSVPSHRIKPHSHSPCSNDCVCSSSIRRRGTVAISVWEKSWPLNSSGWPVALHNAYAKQSPKLSPARWRPLP